MINLLFRCFVLSLCILGSASAQQNTDSSLPLEGENFTPNFSNVDIQSLIGAVARYTGRNFVVDPRVKARVTVIANTPVASDEFYEVFLSVLQVHGFAAVPAGEVIKIVPEVVAKQGPINSFDDDANNTSDDLVTHVFRIKHVPASQLVPILRPLVPQQGHLAAYTATNSLIITDRASNINRLQSIIQIIDIGDNSDIDVVPLRHASAGEIVRIVSALQPQAAQPGDPSGVRLAADDRINAVLVSGDQEARASSVELIRRLDTPVETGGNTQVVYLRYAEAQLMADILRGVSAGQAQVGVSGADGDGASIAPQRSSSGRSDVDIQADEQTNALIITAPPDEMKNVLAVVRQLDIRRAQVLVEAIIADVSESTSRELGINFGAVDNNTGAAILSNLNGAATSLLGAVADSTNLGSGLTSVIGGTSGTVDFGALLRAIAGDSSNNILSTPSLVTMDNQEAEFIVGRNVPFITGTQTNSSGNPFQTIERRDVGISLKIKPQINEGNTVKLQIEQEVSDIEVVAEAQDLATSKRSVKTTVLIEDGQTLVISGLTEQKKKDQFSKVPGLSELPVVGDLFTYRQGDSERRSLMIFIKPAILRDAATGTVLSNRKYNYIRAQQLMQGSDSRSLIKNNFPLLPELVLRYAPDADALGAITQ